MIPTFLRRSIAVAAFIVVTPIAHATVAFVAPNTILLSGLIVEKELVKFDEILNSNRIETVELSDCLGAKHGAIQIIQHMVEAIQLRKLNTAVRDTAASACAVIFLAGERRSFLPPTEGRATLLFFHAAHLVTSEGAEMHREATLLIANEMVRLSQSVISEEVANRLLATKNPSGGLFILRESGKYMAWRGTTFFCTGGELFKPLSCEALSALGSRILR